MNFDKQYANYFGLFESIFEFGVGPFIQPTGFQACRIISGVAPGWTIDPEWISQKWGRGGTGNLLYTTDQESAAFAEVFGHTGDGYIPEGTYRLRFECSGVALNRQLITKKYPEYGPLYLGSGHVFSQCVERFLSEKGLTDQFDSHAWLTVAGHAYGISGYVHGWRDESPNFPVCTHVEPIPPTV